MTAVQPLARRRETERGALVVTALLLGAQAACGPEDVFVEAPEVEGARSYLFALEQDATLRVHAVAAGTGLLGLGTGATPSDESELLLTRVAFAESLAELGLTAGPVPSTADPFVTLGELSPLRTEVARILPGSTQVRLEEATPSPALAAFPLPSRFVCPTQVVTRALGGVEPMVDLVSDGEAIAVALTRASLVVIRDDLSLESFALPVGERAGAITVSDAGRFWVVTTTAVRPFDPVTGLWGEPQLQLPFVEPPFGLYVLEAASEPLVWVLSAEGQLRHYRASSTVPIETFQITPGRIRSDGPAQSSTRFGPRPGGGFLMAHRDISTIVEYTPPPSSGYRETLTDTVGRGYGGIHALSDGSVVAAEMQTGRLWRYQSDRWEDAGLLVSELTGFARWDEDRLLFVGRAGVLGLFSLKQRACPDRALSTWQSPRALAPLGEGFLFLAGFGDGRQLVWLER